MTWSEIDKMAMRRACELAVHAASVGEVPVGAVVVRSDEIIGEGWNQSISQNDPTAHAEIQAIRSAAAKLNNYRIPGTTLYVTLEPCSMCVGAIVHARISRLVFGAADPKTGAVGGVSNLLHIPQHKHRTEFQGGLLAEECGRLLREFFRQRR